MNVANTIARIARRSASHALPVAAVAALAVGCASNNKKDAVSYRTGVTDISAVPPTPAYQTSYQPTYSAPAAQAAQSNSDATASYASAGGTYTVQKGDTLYKIAREHYGDAKAWQKIAAANPNVANGMIKPGQKLILP